MSAPLVHCAGCAREWRSPTMADGLRLVGSCPRCGGALVYAEQATTPIVVERAAAPPTTAETLAPHLVLGVPRR